VFGHAPVARLSLQHGMGRLFSAAAHVTLLGVAVDQVAYAVPFRNWLGTACDNVLRAYFNLLCLYLGIPFPGEGLPPVHPIPSYLNATSRWGAL
jgi:hypothetical protein